MASLEAQRDHPRDVADLGWEKSSHVSQHLVDGMSNEDVFVFIRRFNKQTFHLKETNNVPVGGLDLVVPDDEEFSPNKLRAQFERLYMGLIISMIGFWKHLARLRSWKETRRTGLFCLIYFLAWGFNWLSTLFIVLITAVILSPQARNIMFPPAPLALVSYKSGGLTKPSAGVLGSVDSATGAPESHKGEALENEASNVITGYAALCMHLMVEEDPQGEPNPAGELSTPSPDTIATKMAVVKDKATGVDKPSQDKTSVPIHRSMQGTTKPMLHLLTLVSDFWERFANLISPTPPFPQQLNSPITACVVLSLFVGSRLVTVYMVVKSISFIFGFGLFGDPIFSLVINFLNKNYPHWTQLLSLDRTLLKGVPTNTQVAIAILRHGEETHAPIPPPPASHSSPSTAPLELTDDLINAPGSDLPLNATNAELEEAMSHDPDMVDEAGGPDKEASRSNKHGKITTKALDVFRRTAKAATNTAIGINKARASVTGSNMAKSRVGAVPGHKDSSVSGPVRFAARYDGKKGYVNVLTEAVSPCVTFVKDSTQESKEMDVAKDSDLHWTVPIQEITELKKNPGYGFKSKLMMGWALEKEILDGLHIVDKHGTIRILTAIPQRDGLFNRLCAIGGQKWESL